MMLTALLALYRVRRTRSIERWARLSIALAAMSLVACGEEPTAGVDAAAPTADAGPDGGRESCTPAAMAVVPCGNCGIAQRLCGADGFWQTGECLSEGECAPADLETESTARCGQRTRICDTECRFRAWEVTEVDGVCTPDEERTVAPPAGCTALGVGIERCSSGCRWSPAVCGDGCSNDSRMTPSDDAEVCVPAGPFMRGTNDTSTYAERAFPLTEIVLSGFYIDRFPVTNARYARCVEAGACSPPVEPEYTGFGLPENARRPVQGIQYAEAVQFCSWDGRRLATSAEWEKAVRGPSPRANAFPWDGADYRCDLLGSVSCGYVYPGAKRQSRVYDDVDDLPGTRGFYGTEMQLGGAMEWVKDWYAFDYYSRAESRVDDPQGPADSSARTLRGASRMSPADRYFFVWMRWPGDPVGSVALSNTIRCARDLTGAVP